MFKLKATIPSFAHITRYVYERAYLGYNCDWSTLNKNRRTRNEIEFARRTFKITTSHRYKIATPRHAAPAIVRILYVHI